MSSVSRRLALRRHPCGGAQTGHLPNRTIPHEPFHAVAFVDHQSAQVLQFDSEQVVQRKIHEHVKFTRQHGSGVRTEHEFFAELCDALDGIAEVLVVGGHAGLADFRHYVDKHRPLTAKHVVGYQVVDHPSDNELVALARRHFAKYDQIAGVPLPK